MSARESMLAAGGSNGWMERAACVGLNPEIFFPIGQGVALQAQVEEALQVCRSCPVTAQCAGFAQRVGASEGVWAERVLTQAVRVPWRATESASCALGAVVERSVKDSGDDGVG